MRYAELTPFAGVNRDKSAGKRSRMTLLRGLMLLLVALAIIAGATRLLDRGRGATQADPAVLADLSVSFGPGDYDAAVAVVNRNVLSARDRLTRAPDQWMGHEILARALYSRSKQTGNFADLVEAVSIADLGMTLAPSGSGPILTSAAIALGVHRPDTALGLAAIADGFIVPSPDNERAEIAAIKGDIAFHTGRYSEARRYYQQSMAISPSGSAAYRQATLEARLGAPDKAIQLFIEAAHLTPDRNAEFVANLLLQCGAVELARGDWDAADRLFTLADRRFPGSWLVASYRSQMQAARGDLAAARMGYLAILERNQIPEIMDALALVYRAEGDISNARLWAGQAGTVWEQRTALLPDAVAGHFAEHALVSSAPDHALGLAARAYRRRPNGDQAQLLAAADIAKGDPDRAIEILQLHERKGWRTAALYRQLASAWSLKGDSAKVEQAQAAALALNPRALDGGVAMIRFGHY